TSLCIKVKFGITKAKQKHKYYFFSPTEHIVSWRDARKFCQKQGSDLVLNIKHVSENEGGKSSKDRNTGWIGFYRVGGDTWTGIGGESVDFSAWGQGEPVTNDCGAFDAKETILFLKYVIYQKVFRKRP
uniref:C-type lectin domain-containing protein n=1 Tax=Neogobius melanostomus TaxID=47308 RepID=A0A8C6WFY2_9GOBI